MEAEKYHDMARKFRHNPDLSANFDKLANDARERAKALSSQPASR